MVQYKKTYLSGHLKGQTVDAAFYCPDARSQRLARESLIRYTEDSPGTDIQGHAFVVSDLQFVAHARSLAALSPAMPLSRIQRISDKV